MSVTYNMHHAGNTTTDGKCDCQTCWCQEREPDQPKANIKATFEIVECPHPTRRYMAGMTDKQQKGRFRGEVELIESGRIEIVAIVYGRTLGEMRARKHAIVQALRNPLDHIK